MPKKKREALLLSISDAQYAKQMARARPSKAQSSILAECTHCDGTGVYCGFAEIKGQAVVCVYCRGVGSEEIRYKPFVRRKRRRGVQTVHWSRGAFLPTGVGPQQEFISYADFLKGKMPPNG